MGWLEPEWCYVVCPIKYLIKRLKENDFKKDDIMEWLKTNLDVSKCYECSGYDTKCRVEDNRYFAIRECRVQDVRVKIYDYETKTESITPDIGAWDREYKTVFHRKQHWTIVANKNNKIEFTL